MKKNIVCNLAQICTGAQAEVCDFFDLYPRELLGRQNNAGERYIFFYLVAVISGADVDDIGCYLGYSGKTIAKAVRLVRRRRSQNIVYSCEVVGLQREVIARLEHLDALERVERDIVRVCVSVPAHI